MGGYAVSFANFPAGFPSADAGRVLRAGAIPAAAHLAGDYGIPVSLGNTIMEIGVHIAASLPEVVYLEFSDLAWNRLVKEPVQFLDSQAMAPERPGHGMELDRDALKEFSRPE